jgi:hypothetical protein
MPILLSSQAKVKSMRLPTLTLAKTRTIFLMVLQIRKICNETSLKDKLHALFKQRPSESYVFFVPKQEFRLLEQSKF